MANVSVLLKFFGLAFSALLPLINPVGSALVFLGLVGDVPDATFRDLARKIAVCTILFLVSVELAGTAILTFFGISLPVMQIGGGLVLASMGWRLLNQETAKADPSSHNTLETNSRSLNDGVFYPLTFPVTAGPGVIVVMLTLSAHASSKQLVFRVVAHIGLLLAAAVLSLLVFVCYRYAPKIRDRIPPQTTQGILRVIAFVLLCIGVQITWNGLEPLLKAVLQP